jgi:hypothetical protein
MCLRIGSSGRFCEHGNEHSSSIKDGEYLAQVRNSKPARRAVLHAVNVFSS